MTLHSQVTEDIHLVYPTPILMREVPEAEEINPGLRKIILERARESIGTVKSNYGGWHSVSDLFTWPYPEVQRLQQIIGEAIRSMSVYTTGGQNVSGEVEAVGWANVSWRGDYNKPHHHPGSTWSGVYYVDAGNPAGERPDEAAIEFLDPRGTIDMLPVPGDPFSANFRLRPVAGIIVLFPSWLSHMVNRYDGEGERISIAFNVTILSANLESPSAAG